jgi:alpha-tubulin suppressor-like RCC1 family protein
VASWGDNSWGELGDGTTAPLRTLYGDIAAGSDVVQVAAGRTHNLAVRSDGTVTAWGLNDHGALGDGTTTDRSTPVQVSGLSGVITQVAAGEAFSLALRSGGTVWAWGRNDRGQLGRGTISGGELVPARVSVLNRVTKIAAGRDFALALRSDGIVFAWGTDRFGQLNVAPAAAVTRPVNSIAAGSRITQISAGGGHMLALRSDGTVLGWGFNVRGQLGNGIQTQVSGPVQVTNLGGATQVAAGTVASYAVRTMLVLAGQSS